MQWAVAELRLEHELWHPWCWKKYIFNFFHAPLIEINEKSLLQKNVSEVKINIVFARKSFGLVKTLCFMSSGNLRKDKLNWFNNKLFNCLYLFNSTQWRGKILIVSLLIFVYFRTTHLPYKKKKNCKYTHSACRCLGCPMPKLIQFNIWFRIDSWSDDSIQ